MEGEMKMAKIEIKEKPKKSIKHQKITKSYQKPANIKKKPKIPKPPED